MTKTTTGSDDALFREAYDELRRLAGGALVKLSPGATLQPTALVHEAWLRLGSGRAARARNREHFLALAALAMRQILVDAARRRRAAKRGGEAGRVTLVDGVLREEHEPIDVLDLHEALEKLAVAAPRPARQVELRFFGGLDAVEAARVLGVAESTARLDWRFAKAWLAERLGPGQESR